MQAVTIKLSQSNFLLTEHTYSTCASTLGNISRNFLFNGVKNLLCICLNVLNVVKSFPFQRNFQFRKQVEVDRNYQENGGCANIENWYFAKNSLVENVIVYHVIVIENSIHVFSRYSQFLWYIFSQTLKNTFIVFLIDCLSPIIHSRCTRCVKKTRGLFELYGSSWFQGNYLGVARFVQIS